MNLTPFLFRSLVRLLLSLIVQPVASVSTLLFYSDILPQHMVSERLVRHELLDRENYLFHFLVNFLKCFW
uniref:Secreted protein n=1 Tax=Cucumis sativus TaxID=3659 RepID=A0A0A0LTU9_CUCSA